MRVLFFLPGTEYAEEAEGEVFLDVGQAFSGDDNVPGYLSDWVPELLQDRLYCWKGEAYCFWTEVELTPSVDLEICVHHIGEGGNHDYDLSEGWVVRSIVYEPAGKILVCHCCLQGDVPEGIQ